VEAGAKRLAQVILGASHLAQSAVPALLDPDNLEVVAWKAQLRQTLQHQATVLCDKLKTVPGLRVLESGGAMYVLVRLDLDHFDPTVVANDREFCQRLLQEQNVFVLPGTPFGMPNSFRAVFCAPASVLEQAADRIAQFCQAHARVKQE